MNAIQSRKELLGCPAWSVDAQEVILHIRGNCILWIGNIIEKCYHTALDKQEHHRYEKPAFSLK